MEDDNLEIQSKPQINVNVTDPQLDQVGGYTTYLISGNDSLGTFQIRRRYNDFFYYRQALKKKWPGLYIPPIPQKKLTGNKDQQHVQMRKKFFDFFLHRLAKIKYLFYCSTSQQFLRNRSIDMEKYYQTLANPNPIELIQEYKKIFGDVQGSKNNQTELRNITNNFNGFLKKAQKETKNMKSQLSIIVESRNQFMENLNKCNNVMLPQYQKNIFSQYLGNAKRQPVLLFVHNHKVQDNIRNLRDHSTTKGNPFDLCLNLIIYEAREIEAMQQAIVIRQSYENKKKSLEQKLLQDQAEVAKLAGGKTTFKSFFSKGSKNQQMQILQKSIPQTQKQIQSMSQLCEIINHILGSIEIPRFKKQKQKQYYQMMATVSQKQLEFLSAYGQFMKSLIDGLNN